MKKFLLSLILFLSIPYVNAAEYTYDINLNDNGKSMEVVFNGTKPIVWKNNIATGSYQVSMNHSTGKFDLNSLQTYAYFDILYTTDVLDGFVNVNGGQGAFASGEYNPVCIDSGEGPLKTCVIQIPVLRNSANYSCSGFNPDSLCSTDNLNLTFYNWSESPGELNIYGGYFTNNFVTSDKYYLQKILSAINQLKIDEQIQQQKETNQKLDELKDSITSSNTNESETQANSFFDNFDTDTYGLSDIISMPLTLIKSLTNSTCVSLKLTIPFVNKELNLPCMSSIYSQFFGSFFTLYQTVTFGFVAYWVSVRIFNLVKDFKNPDHDEIEVLDL